MGQGTPATLTHKKDRTWHSQGSRGSWDRAQSFHASSQLALATLGFHFQKQDAATERDLLDFYLCCNKTINLVTLKQYKCIIVQEARSQTWLSLG